jgi:hypothetical protein
MRYRTVIESNGKTAAGIRIPPERSQQRWYVLPIADAKTPETRQRRVVKAIAMLREGRKR